MPTKSGVPTIPQTADELNEMLNNDDVMSNVLSDPKAFREWITNYQDTVLNKDPELLDQVKEQTEKVMVDFLREHQVENLRHLNLDPNSRKPVAKNTIYNKSAMGAKYDDYFEDIENYFYGISDHAYKDADLSKKVSTLKNDMSSVKPSDGGFLIPEVLRAEMLQVALETAIVRSRARVIPMDSLRVPFPAVDSTSNVSSVHGGITGYWTEEGATLTESQPRFARVVLEAHKLTLYTEVPNELFQDSRPSAAAFLNQVFPEALAWFEDVAFFVGGGVGEPLGFLNAPAAVNVTRSTTVAGANIEWIDLANMYARMLPQSLNRAVWIISPDAIPNLLTMPFTGSTSPILLGGGGFSTGAVGAPMTILGRPVIVSEKARALGTTGDINFVDFGFYLLGDRQAMSARQSEEFAFNRDVTCFRVIERVDGRPWLLSPITPQNNGNTLSPYVKLTTNV